MSAYAFTAMFNSVVAFAFGLWVYLLNPKRNQNRRWLVVNLAISLWTFSQFMREMSTSTFMAGIWGIYGVYISATFIPVTYTHFIFSLMGDIKGKSRHYVRILYLGAAILSGAILFTNLIIREISPNPFFRYYVTPGSHYLFFLSFFGGVFFLSFVFLAIGIKRSTGLIRDQLTIVLAASLISVIGGSTSFLPVLKINVFPFGNYFVSLYAFLISYGVFKHRLMDLNIFLRKSLSVGIVILTFIIPVFILTVLAQNYFFSTVSPLFTIIVVISLILATVTFPWFRLKAEETLVQVLFPARRDYSETIARLSQETVTILDLPKLLGSIAATISRVFNVLQVGIMIPDEKRGQYRIQKSFGYNPDFISKSSLPVNSPIVNYFQDNPDTLYQEMREDQGSDKAGKGNGPSREEIFDKLGSALIIPLVVKSRLAGIVLMGPKNDGRPYSIEDLELLRTLANQAAIAMENARLYEDLKRSKQYIRRADRLASLGTLAAGLAHEIRNPLVSIKTFIQLLPQRIDDEDFRTNFMSIAKDEVERIQHLVEELLDFAKPSEPNLAVSDLNEIVEKTVLLVENDLKSKKIELKTHLDPELREIMIDKEQIKQVILNIMINSIQAIEPNGNISVVTRTVGVRGDKPSAQIEITDDGPGIGEADLENIFNPFFTTKHMGSGLGLAISHQIIKEHHGSIEAESTQGKGTVFFINLPIDPRRHERRRSRVE